MDEVEEEENDKDKDDDDDDEEADDDNEEDMNDDEKDPNEWLGLVQWTREYSPFADGGDSGSLVYTTVNNIMIPLGIHVGAPSKIPYHSVFVSLETYCFEAEREGWTLRFSEQS